MMKIRLTALDTLFFRDGKPFDRGEETWASGIFPPAPSVFYGALRSLFFVKNPHEISKAGQKNDPTIHLEITNIQIFRDNGIVFSCPADVVKSKFDDEINLLQLRIKEEKQSSNVFDSYELVSIEEVESLIGEEFVINTDFEDYLNGEIPYSTFKIADVITSEPKVGIGRDNLTHVAEEGKLYRVGMLRLADSDNNKMSFEITFDLDNFKLNKCDKGFIKLGGEAKAMAYEVIEDKEKDTYKNKGQYFKMYLTSPSLFKSGWKPSFIGEDLIGKWNGINVELIAASLGKPKYIGGFDMKKKQPKAMLKAIPEGAVYFFKILDNDTTFEVIQPFCISDYNQNEGFGLAYCAKVNTQFQNEE